MTINVLGVPSISNCSQGPCGLLPFSVYIIFFTVLHHMYCFSQDVLPYLLSPKLQWKAKVV